MLILAVWAACLCWVVPYCATYGYRPLPEGTEPELVLGMPGWVFWGVAVPWGAASLASLAMCLFVIQDDDLGEAPESRHDTSESAV